MGLTPLTLAQWLGLVALLAFSWVYDRVVAWTQRHRAGDFTAAQVIVGLLVILTVFVLDSWQQVLTGASAGLLLFLHCAAGGFFMTLGSWQRRTRRVDDPGRAGRS